MCISGGRFVAQATKKSYKAWRRWSYDRWTGRLGPAYISRSLWDSKTKIVRSRPSRTSDGNSGLHAWATRKQAVEHYGVFGQVLVHGTVSVFNRRGSKGKRHGYLSTKQTILRLYVGNRTPYPEALAKKLSAFYKVPVKVVG